jgi:hypothetical protein
MGAPQVENAAEGREGAVLIRDYHDCFDPMNREAD